MGRASEYRKRAASALSDVTVPSGAVFTVRQFDPEAWMVTGYAPEHIVCIFLELEKKGEASVEEPENLAKFGEMMRHIIARCSVDPVVKVEEAGEDELAVTEIDYPDLKHLFLYLTKQLPEAAVATSQGSVTVDAVTQFREGEPGSEAAQPGSNGGGVLGTTIAVTGHH